MPSHVNIDTAVQTISYALPALSCLHQHNPFKQEYINFKMKHNGVVEVNVNGSIVPISFTSQGTTEGVFLAVQAPS